MPTDTSAVAVSRSWFLHCPCMPRPVAYPTRAERDDAAAEHAACPGPRSTWAETRLTY